MIACLRAAQALRQVRPNGFDKDSTPSTRPLQAIESLRWWIRVGVTYALDEMPHDRFARQSWPKTGVSAARETPRSRRPNFRARCLRLTSRALQDARRREMPETAEISARALAQAATDLEMLRSIMAEFDGCALKRHCHPTCVRGRRPWLTDHVVGEAPGEGEDRIGRPFVGRAGQLLDRMLSAIGLDRQKVYIANVVPWRPPGNRTPTLRRRRSVCLSLSGRSTSPTLNTWFASADPQLARSWASTEGLCVRGARGSPIRVKAGREIQALAMLHPAFLLRQPAHKRFAWADMRALARALKRRVAVKTLGQNGRTKGHARLSLTSSPASALSISFRVSSNP